MAATPERPGRRPLPPPNNDPPAPSLPPRPGGKSSRPLPPPQEPGEIYDDCEEQQPALPQRPVVRNLPQPFPISDEVYDDCNEDRETQLLPCEEVYDDFEEEKHEKQLPKRPGVLLPLHHASPPEESYDDLENLGPVVVQPKKLMAARNLPPPPPSASQMVETKKPLVLQPINDEVYEDPEMENGHKESMTRLDVGRKERSSSLSPVRSPGRDQRDSSPQSLSRTLNHHSPARNNPSPKGSIERNLPPIPVLREGDGRGRAPELPPLPSINSKQQMPNAAKAQNKTDMVGSSPVIVPLGHPKKGVLPPVPPQSEKPFRPDPPVKVSGRRTIETEDDVLETDEHSSAEQDSIYEVSADFEEEPPSPPLPPKLDPKPSKPAPKVPSLQPAAFMVDQSQISALKNNLRKVPVDGSKNTRSEPKEYVDNHSMSELHQMFQQKAMSSETPDKRDKVSVKPVSTEKPLLPPTKPIIPMGKPLGTGRTPANPSPVAKVSTEAKSQPLHGSPEITILPKPPKEENKTVPVTPPPLPSLAKTPTAVLPPVQKPEDDYNPEEIYDDATSADLLDRFDWYHGAIDRKVGESRVKNCGDDGTYLVRTSNKNTKFPYTLVVLHKDHVSNMHIRLRSDQKYALGDEKGDEVAFKDLPEMISHHQKYPVLLMGNIKSQVKLQKTPPKK